MPSTMVRGLISLALLLPTTLALPFDWSFFTGKAYEEAAWPSHESHHPRPHWTYTMTATSDGAFPTAPATTSYAYPTGTSTATAYIKRDLHHHSFPTAFPTGAYPCPTAGTGTGFSYPTTLPSWASELEQEVADELDLSWKEKRFFEGPRRHFAGQWKPTWAPHWRVTSSLSGSAAPTGSAPSGTAPAVSGAPNYGW